MAQILITAGLFLLVIISLFLVLVVLMQRANSDGGLGTAFGSGITESAFGTEAGNVMTKITRISIVVFFIIGFILYLAILAQHNKKPESTSTLFDKEAAAEVQQSLETAKDADQTAAATDTEAAPAAEPAATETAPADSSEAPAAPAEPAPAK